MTSGRTMRLMQGCRDAQTDLHQYKPQDGCDCLGESRGRRENVEDEVSSGAWWVLWSRVSCISCTWSSVSCTGDVLDYTSV